MSTEEQVQALAGIGKVVAYYGFMAVAAYFGLKYGLKETATRLEQHITEDQKNFTQIAETQENINGKLDTAIGLLQDHSIALAEHDTRASGMRERQERIDAKISSIDEKLTDLRIQVAGKI